jgi:hypothetical protein
MSHTSWPVGQEESERDDTGTGTWTVVPLGDGSVALYSDGSYSVWRPRP